VTRRGLYGEIALDRGVLGLHMSFATPKLKKGAVKSFKTIAKPDYYQW